VRAISLGCKKLPADARYKLLNIYLLAASAQVVERQTTAVIAARDKACDGFVAVVAQQQGLVPCLVAPVARQAPVEASRLMAIVTAAYMLRHQ
jgi:hypothetical protein